VNRAGVTDCDDYEPCYIRDAIPIVVKDATLPDGWTIPLRKN
jgi:hypothetical protein